MASAGYFLNKKINFSTKILKFTAQESLFNCFPLKKIKIPLLLLQAENDKIVNKKPQNEFCKNASPLCQEFQIDGAYHELFVEKDSMRAKALTALLDFIAKILMD